MNTTDKDDLARFQATQVANLSNKTLLRWMFGFLKPVKLVCAVACLYLAVAIAGEVLATRQTGAAIDRVKDFKADKSTSNAVPGLPPMPYRPTSNPESAGQVVRESPSSYSAVTSASSAGGAFLICTRSELSIAQSVIAPTALMALKANRRLWRNFERFFVALPLNWRT